MHEVVDDNCRGLTTMQKYLQSARLQGLCLLLLLVVSTSTSAAMIRGVTGQLKLMATINGGPAFREVVWHLKPMRKTTAASEVTITRHSAVIDLEAGKYQVDASSGDSRQSQVITIEEGGKHDLIINLR